jgi:hypothetical protein
MYKRLALFLLIIIFLLGTGGCSAAATQQASPAAAPAAPQESGGAANRSSDSIAGAPNQPNAPAADTAALDKRLVIRNATLTIMVDDPGTAMTAITRMTEKMEGFVVTSNLFKTTTNQGVQVPEASITVRVPADKLNDALDQIKALVKDKEKDVQAEQISGQDVTKEYTDLQSRLTNLQNAEAQLREVMASATKTEDVLAVYNQLTQIREQIEVLKGQIQYYQESAAMSSIAVQIRSLASVQPIEIGGWQPVGVARDALQTLIDTLQFLGSAAIWIILYILPVGLLIFLPLRFLWWLFRRNRKNQAPPAVPPAPPAPQVPVAKP